MPQRLAQHLIARGLLPARVVDEALRRLGREGGSLDTVLLEMGAVSEVGILQAVSDVSGVRLVNLADFEPNAEAGPLMPLKMARQLNVVPLSVDGSSLHLACAYPLQQAQLKEVGFLLGRKLELWVALECRVRDWQESLYGQPAEPRYQKLLSQLEPTRPRPREEPVGSESVSEDVLELRARGVVDEPLLLDKPKKKKDPARPRPKIEILDEPAVKGAADLPLALGDEDDPKTSVLDPTAYSRFARNEHGRPEDSRAGVPLEEFQATRVMDVSGYKNFAKEFSNQPPGEPARSGPAAPPPPPPKISFPGGVLPPRKEAAEPAPPPRRKTDPMLFVQPAPPSRPSGEKVRPAEGKAAPAPKGNPSPVPAPPPRAAPPPPTRTAPVDEMDFSDVNEALSAPAPARAAPPPEPPTPPGLPQPALQPAPAPRAPIITAAPVEPPPPSDATQRVDASALLATQGALAPAEDATPLSRPAPPTGASPPARSTAPPQQEAPPPQQEAPAAQPEVEAAEAWQQPQGAWEAQQVAEAQAWAQQATPAAAINFNQSGILQVPPGLAASSATEWSLTQARQALREAVQDREQLMNVVLEYARRTFEYAASFAVMRGAAVGWDARGEGDLSAIRQLAVPLDTASVFRTVALTRGSYVGPLPPDALSQHYLALLGRVPRTVFVWPVEVRSRLVAMLYGDCGARPISQRRLADFILFCQELPGAFHELILFRKQNPRVPQQFASSDSYPDPGSVPDSGPAQPQATADGDWFSGLISLLTGPDPSERSMAMLELMKAPEAAAQALSSAFPGPTAWSRLPVVELPEPDELGPIPGALARLGQAGASAVAPLLDHADSDTRYLALLTAGSLRYPDVVDGVLRALFDFEPDLSSAARAAAASLRLLPHFQSRLPLLREELTSADALRCSLAARALGVLHDRLSVEPLIALTGSDDDLCAQSAADALKEIARAGFGTHPDAWTAWWARASGLRRIEWLVEALDAEDFDLRLAAIEELSKTFGDNFGYFADGPENDRQGAVARWKAVVASRTDLDL